MVRFDRIDLPQLHPTFREAFSDYLVDMSSVTEEMLLLRNAKNNVDLDLSPGVFEGDRMVAFTLIGLGEWEGAPAAFDSGTGIIPDYRGQGLAKGMMDHALPELRERGVSRFLLEVIRENYPAIRAYRKAGFEITRQLACYVLHVKDVLDLRPLATPFSIRPLGREAVESFEAEMDWTPSWENGLPSMRRVHGGLVTFGAFEGETGIGVIAYSPELNWLMSLVVARSHRRRNVGLALVRHLLEQLPERTEAIKLLNVDRSDGGTQEFLRHLGCEHMLDQYEMARPV
jgi:ribosomal protein S18 acetylase RimI-like enzyme